jgi:hypothetical protein
VPGVIDRLRARPELLDRVRAAIREVPGVADVIVGADLDARKLPNDRVVAAAALSHYRERSGDFVILPKANWFFVPELTRADPGGTTHGTAQPYDARVPVLFMGAGITPGTYDGPAAPIDIAPTLARLCGFTLPHATGRVLEAALKADASAQPTRATRRP